MTQKEKVLKHLQKYGNIDTWTCFKKYRITRLSEYIRELRVEGYNIESHWIKPKTGNPFVKYIYTKKESLQQQ